MSEFVILVPVLGRPERAALCAENVQAASQQAHRLLFLCSPGDAPEIAACRATGADVALVSWRPGPADWARKLEYGRSLSREPYMVLAADDLRFHPGWDKEALHILARKEIGVLGTQDGGNPLVLRGLHSTHPIVSRGYIDSHGTIDEPHLMLHQGYDHQYADNELCETAMARGMWQFARAVYLEHLHPSWHKGSWDVTYRKGARHVTADRTLFMRRRRLWRPRGRSALQPRQARNPARDQTGVKTPSARYGQIAHRRRKA